MESTCETPFWNSPIGFLNEFNLKYRPDCKYQIWNFTFRLFILGLIVGLIGVPLCGWQSIGICILFAVVIGFIIIMTSPMQYYPAKVVTFEETQLTPTISSYQSRDVLIEREAAKEGKYEGFVNPIPVDNGIVSRIVGVEANLPVIDASPYSGPSLPDYTPPSARNPFMNVLLDEYK